MTPFQKCPHENQCGGCPWILIEDSEQKARKIQYIQKLLAENSWNAHLQYHPVGRFSERTRFDFTIIDSKICLYHRQSHEPLPVQTCPQLIMDLQNFLSDLQKISIPIKKGSARIRIGKDNLRGIWLDFANTDIKNLLEEKTTLTELQKICDLVEIGQKRKILNTETMKLKDPEFHPWFKTWHQGKEVWLYQHIGSFTQASKKSNQIITHLIAQSVEQSNAKVVVEFGSGFGNLTIPCLSEKREIHCYEFEISSQRAIEKTLHEYNLNHYSIQYHIGDFQNTIPQLPLNTDLLLVNPPRSGLKKFADLAKTDNLKNIIYMSCYPKSFIEDCQVFERHGFKIKGIDLVDQFPQTEHIELIATLEKS